jgi:hypothetical protein
MHMKKIIAIIVLCFLPLSAYCLSDREAFELLSQKTEEIKQFPFHVYITPGYAGFQGVPLPVSLYGFFARSYEDLKDNKLSDEIFATFQFSQGTRWRCFLLRVPGMYAIEAIDIWIFNTEQNTWQTPMKIAEWWGDAGYSIDIQAWIEDVNRDGWFDIVRRTLEKNIDLEDPKFPATTKTQNNVFVWDKDHFKDVSSEYSPKLKLKKYRFNEEGKK